MGELSVASAIHVAALEPTHLRGVTRLRVYDPEVGPPGMLLSLPACRWVRRFAEQTLDVHIDRTRAAAQLITIRTMIASV